MGLSGPSLIQSIYKTNANSLPFESQITHGPNFKSCFSKIIKCLKMSGAPGGHICWRSWIYAYQSHFNIASTSQAFTRAIYLHQSNHLTPASILQSTHTKYIAKHSNNKTSSINFSDTESELFQVNQVNTRADSRFVPSQWETSLQSNAVSHWLGANLESSLNTMATLAPCIARASAALILSQGNQDKQVLVIIHTALQW